MEYDKIIAICTHVIANAVIAVQFCAHGKSFGKVLSVCFFLQYFFFLKDISHMVCHHQKDHNKIQ